MGNAESQQRVAQPITRRFRGQVFDGVDRDRAWIITSDEELEEFRSWILDSFPVFGIPRVRKVTGYRDNDDPIKTGEAAFDFAGGEVLLAKIGQYKFDRVTVNSDDRQVKGYVSYDFDNHRDNSYVAVVVKVAAVHAAAGERYTGSIVMSKDESAGEADPRAMAPCGVEQRVVQHRMPAGMPMMMEQRPVIEQRVVQPRMPAGMPMMMEQRPVIEQRVVQPRMPAGMPPSVQLAAQRSNERRQVAMQRVVSEGRERPPPSLMQQVQM
eukprot:g6214.t1